MTRVRTIGVALVLLAAASATARAQQWGGSPPVRTSGETLTSRVQRAANAEVVFRGFYTLVPAPPLESGQRGRNANPGGAWSGAQSTWGGSPPPAPTSRGPAYYFPTPVLVAPVGVRAVSASEASTAVPLRVQYLRERGRR